MRIISLYTDRTSQPPLERVSVEPRITAKSGDHLIEQLAAVVGAGEIRAGLRERGDVQHR